MRSVVDLNLTFYSISNYSGEVTMLASLETLLKYSLRPHLRHLLCPDLRECDANFTVGHAGVSVCIYL